MKKQYSFVIIENESENKTEITSSSEYSALERFAEDFWYDDSYVPEEIEVTIFCKETDITKKYCIEREISYNIQEIVESQK